MGCRLTLVHLDALVAKPAEAAFAPGVWEATGGPLSVFLVECQNLEVMESVANVYYQEMEVVVAARETSLPWNPAVRAVSSTDGRFGV